MKTCPRCKIEKPLTEFHRKGLDKRQSFCKVCSSETRAQWARDNRPQHQAHSLRWKFGISTERLVEMQQNQNNQCAMCGRQFTGRFTSKIDHDHRCCGKHRACANCVRALLCNKCNTFLGSYENEELKKLADNYLAKHKRL